ncbi:MerR family transcriptional regulator [Azoarcus taiwanensis]|uniref:MerR family transcriptional regulator n=1 Tax=Azoarcus taiwanensis TaxID=666964 RepID=A0A972F8T4_9RHOO|nr:MerR family transcriptional regulator [Azoarcus taiwanensis]NMG04309.1 MerR family transcriptional regulator [Azoarcus taiwanensis]
MTNQELFSISSVERDTGLSKDTLRVWERRYGFPQPDRDDNGDRAYPREQVEKLRLIRRLLDQGKRPSKVVAASTAELVAMLEETAVEAPQAGDIGETDFLRLVRLHRSVELRTMLQQLVLKQGLQRFASETVTALNVAIGQAWVRGELDVCEEHLYSEQIQNVLRNAIGSHSGGGSRPRILLTTFPDEQHGLGLLMAEAVLVPEGATCISIGVQTPLGDIRTAAIAGQFDVVALSFSGAFPVRQAVEGLNQLRGMLPPEIALWAGGAALQGRRAKLDGIRVIYDLHDALAALGEWRTKHAT